MKTFFRILLFSFVLIHAASAEDMPVHFDNPELEKRYYELIEEVRCLVCQNQSLADSHADLANDLRHEIYEKVIAGESNNDIINFLVARYGDFVLYRPPLQSNTWLLWFGPFCFLIIGLLVAMFIIKHQTKEESGS